MWEFKIPYEDEDGTSENVSVAEYPEVKKIGTTIGADGLITIDEE